MWMDAHSDEKGHSDDYGPDYGGPDYDGTEYDGPGRPGFDRDGADYDDAEYGEGRDLRDDQAYWRRRFLILCGGVVALGVCAWMFPGAHQPSKREAAATSASVAALARQQALPSAAEGASWPGDTMPDAYPTAGPASAAPTAGPTSTAKKTIKKAIQASKPGTADHPNPAASASPSGAQASACAPADIVLSLSVSRPSYAGGAHPSFDVYAVSTGTAACTLTYGAGSVQVVVTHDGHVVWDSAACQPAPAGSVRFTRGVPQVLTVVWNPGVIKPAGCAGSWPSGASGTLDAVAMSHGQSSPVSPFKLGG